MYTKILDTQRLAGVAGMLATLLVVLAATDVNRSAIANPTGGTPRIGITKEFTFSESPGALTYLVRLNNGGTASAAGARLIDPMPAGISAWSWSCVGINGATCANASGAGAIDEPIDALSVDGVLEYTIIATVEATPPPFVTNVARVELLPGGTCATDETPPCRATLTASTGAVLETYVTASAFASPPGASVQFDIQIDSLGSVDAAGSIVRVPVPPGLTDVTWTCGLVGRGAPCPVGAGAGAIEQNIGSLPSGSSLFYTVTGTITASPPTDITLIAIAIPPYGGSCFLTGPQRAGPYPSPCIDSARVATVAKILADMTAELAGNTIVYTLSLRNVGVEAGSSTVAVPLPAGVSGFAWNCNAEFGAVCPAAAGSGPISETIANWPTFGLLTYQINATLAAQPPAIVVNTATITPPAGGVCGQFDTTPAPCLATAQVNVNQGGLAVIKFADRTAVSAGEFFTYTILVENNTASLDASGSVFVDPVPPGLDAFYLWNCGSKGGAVCPESTGSGPINATIASFPADGGLIYTVTALVGSAPPATIVNIATLTPPAGLNVTCDGTDAPPPCSDEAQVSTVPIMAVSKFSGVQGVTAGSPIDYSIDVYNFGTEAAVVQIDDPVPPGIASMSWTCSNGERVSCPQSSGSGPISATVTAFGTDSGLQYSVQAIVGAAPPPVITNIVTVTPPAGSVCLVNDGVDLTSPPCVAEAVNTAAPLLDLTKTGNGQQLLRNGPARYTVELRNLGGAADGAILNDPVPPGLDNVTWSCTGFLGAVCPDFSGAGAIAATIATFPANGYLVYAIDAVVAPTAQASITNVATVTPPAGGACGSGGCSASVTQSVTLAPSADIRVGKTADVTQTTPGGTVTWTIDVRNGGALAATGLQISDPVADGVGTQTWTCAGPECPATSGSGAIDVTVPILPVYVEDGPDLPVRSGRLLFTVVAQVSPTPSAIINNVATIVPVAGATCQAAVCTATSSVPTGVVGAPVLELSQTASAAQLVAGGTVDYTITLLNSGTAAAGATGIENPLPAGIDAFAWNCSATGGAICPNANGLGAINQTLSLIPAGAAVTYTITATVTAAPPATVINSVTVTPPAAASCVPASCVVNLSLPTVAAGQPLLALSKTADRAILVPGGSVLYTVSVANVGTADAGPVVLSDAIPAGLTAFAWTCQPTGSATCPSTSGNGPIAQTMVLPAGSSLVYRVQASVSSSASGTVANTATLAPPAGTSCNPASCSVIRALPVQSTPAVADITVGKTAVPAAGVALNPGQRVTWTLRAINSGGASSSTLTVIDSLPSNVVNVLVATGSGITCNATGPAPGSALTCTVAAGFTGQRSVTITADVMGPDTQGRLVNTIAVQGGDGADCGPCTTTHPVNAGIDVALRNPRPFSAAGIAGTLVDIVNLEPAAATAITVSLGPVASQRLLAVYSSGCTATEGPDGQVSVSCPSPPQTQGAACSGSQCTIAQLTEGSAVTLFVALNPQSTATLTASAAGDIAPGNNSIELTSGDTP